MAGDINRMTIDWYRTPIERATLRELTRKSNVRGALQTLGHLGLLAATGAAAFFSVGRLPVVVTILILLLHGTFYRFLSNAHHELCHRTVFKSRVLNEFFMWFIGFITWHDHVLFRASHTRHHIYTLHPPDDLEVVLPAKESLSSFLLRGIVDPLGFVNLVVRYVRVASGRLKGEWEHILFPESDSAGRRRYFNYARIMLAGHAVLLGVSFATGFWILPVLVTFAIAYGGFLQLLCNQTQHSGLVDETTDYRLCCRTFQINPVLRFLYWQMNYHTEHHMYAAVPFFNLPRLHRLIEHDLPPTPKGLVTTWRRIFAILDRQKREPEYKFHPELPSTTASR